MTKNRLFLDIHAIQTLPPSNINRDDTGSPKTAQYGGVRRARVSSQSWKRAMRKFFHENGDTANVGIRSLDIVRYVADKIQALDSNKTDEEAMKMVDKAINNAGVKTAKQRARALFFLGNSQAEQLAQAAVEGVEDKAALKKIINDNPAVDIALFGRMVADDPSLNEDASSQVAHAISTHAVQTEFDFYTAVDDLAPEDNAGAGMLGTLEYNSSTLYRYANVAVHELMQQLNNEEVVLNTLKLFIESFVKSMPTGKINSYANQTLPQVVVLSVRNDRPANLVTAFENPVKSSNGNVEQSVTRLFEELGRVEKILNPAEFTLYLNLGDAVEPKVEVIEEASLNSLLEDFGERTKELIDTDLGE